METIIITVPPPVTPLPRKQFDEERIIATRSIYTRPEFYDFLGRAVLSLMFATNMRRCRPAASFRVALARVLGPRWSTRGCCAARLFSSGNSTTTASASSTRDVPTTMRAVGLASPGPPDSLKYQRQPVPQLSDYQQPGGGSGGGGGAEAAARVRVLSCAVAYRDIIDRTGGFPFMQQPTILGHEFAGVVESVGSDVDPATLAPGDKVVSLHWAQELGWPAPFDSPAAMQTFLGLGCNGGYAEYVQSPQQQQPTTMWKHCVCVCVCVCVRVCVCAWFVAACLRMCVPD